MRYFEQMDVLINLQQSCDHLDLFVNNMKQNQ
jgi:hypothetical protein